MNPKDHIEIHLIEPGLETNPIIFEVDTADWGLVSDTRILHFTCEDGKTYCYPLHNVAYYNWGPAEE